MQDYVFEHKTSKHKFTITCEGEEKANELFEDVTKEILKGNTENWKLKAS